MLLRVELDVADLAATRFAISPLSETTRAMLLLANSSSPAVNRPWVRWARAELARQPVAMPRTWPLVINGLPVYPEFLVPAPAVRAPGIDAELARLRATPAEPVRASLRRVFGDQPWPDSATELFERPAESLAEIAAELGEFHERLITPHWGRILAVCETDIAYRSGLLANGGARSLFSDLHPDLNWSGGTLTLNNTGEAPSSFQVMLGPDGVVLMPSVFNWPQVSISQRTSSQTTLLYPARGTATVWEEGALPPARRPWRSCWARREPGCWPRFAPPRPPPRWPSGWRSRRARSPSTWPCCTAAAWSSAGVAGARCCIRPRSWAWRCWSARCLER